MPQLIGGLAVLGACVWVISELLAFIFKYWYVPVTIAVLGALAYWLLTSIAEQGRRQANKEAEDAAMRRAKQAELERIAQEQERYRHELRTLDESALSAFEVLPQQLGTAEDHLDQAILDFKDRAFAPFWDSIEGAVNLLSQFDRGIQRLETSAARHTEIAAQCHEPPPSFPLSRDAISRVPVGKETSKRLQAIVRQAQRDFQFASIFEQRKTNQILSSGFRSLAHALSDMTSQITSSLDSLSGSVESMRTSFAESMDTLNQEVSSAAAAANRHHQERSKFAQESAARQERAMVMLDNIQRRRRPVL